MQGQVLKLVFQSIYFFLPGYFANLSASLSRRIKFLDFLAKPVDCGKFFQGYPIFGSHKTWRGIISGSFLGILTAFFQKWLYLSSSFFKDLSIIDYSKLNIFLFGFLLSFGALFGDLLFAFFKRRNGIKPGDPWIPFDQINFLIGGFCFITPYVLLPIKIWIILLICTFFLHILANRLGYILKLQKVKW
jgi:CDP-2,3-bis-(O-geranylgeranyl)-sn-glycerol synthase